MEHKGIWELDTRNAYYQIGRITIALVPSELAASCIRYRCVLVVAPLILLLPDCTAEYERSKHIDIRTPC